jgi:zinc resistance-associated protein
MRKTALAIPVIVTLAGSTLIQAQDRPQDGLQHEHFQLSAEDRAAFLDGRVAALKAALRLKPDQDAKWPPVEQAWRNLAKLRDERIAAWRNEAPSSDPVERLQRRAEALIKMGTALKQLSDATTPLYQSLDEGQKRRFVVLARFLHGRHQHRHGWGDHEYRQDDDARR